MLPSLNKAMRPNCAAHYESVGAIFIQTSTTLMLRMRGREDVWVIGQHPQLWGVVGVLPDGLLSSPYLDASSYGGSL